MRNLILVLPALACPVGMGAMMWMMMRSVKGASMNDQPQQAELTSLRVEVDQLRAAARGPEDARPAGQAVSQ